MSRIVGCRDIKEDMKVYNSETMPSCIHRHSMEILSMIRASYPPTWPFVLNFYMLLSKSIPEWPPHNGCRWEWDYPNHERMYGCIIPGYNKFDLSEWFDEIDRKLAETDEPPLEFTGWRIPPTITQEAVRPEDYSDDPNVPSLFGNVYRRREDVSCS